MCLFLPERVNTLYTLRVVAFSETSHATTTCLCPYVYATYTVVAVSTSLTAVCFGMVVVPWVVPA